MPENRHDSHTLVIGQISANYSSYTGPKIYVTVDIPNDTVDMPNNTVATAKSLVPKVDSGLRATVGRCGVQMNSKDISLINYSRV